MRFRDIRAGVTGGNPVPSHLAAATTPARPKSTALKHPPAWYGARIQMARDTIPANAEDAFVLNEIEHMCRRAEECEHDHRGVPRG